MTEFGNVPKLESMPRPFDELLEDSRHTLERATALCDASWKLRSMSIEQIFRATELIARSRQLAAKLEDALHKGRLL